MSSKIDFWHASKLLFCPLCGIKFENPKEAKEIASKSCKNCGELFEKGITRLITNNSEVQKCGNCSSLSGKLANFCGICGYGLEKYTIIVQEAMEIKESSLTKRTGTKMGDDDKLVGYNKSGIISMVIFVIGFCIPALIFISSKIRGILILGLAMFPFAILFLVLIQIIGIFIGIKGRNSVVGIIAIVGNSLAAIAYCGFFIFELVLFIILLSSGPIMG